MTPLFYQWIVVAGTLFTSLSAGATMGYSGVLLYQLRQKDSDIQLDLDTSSWIGSIHGFAALPAVIAPFVMQWKGRKFTFIAASIVVIMGWILLYKGNGIAVILLSESFHGFGANVLMTVSYDYLSEMITPSYRNVALQSYATVNAMGLSTAGIMTKFVHWRTQSIILCIPALIGVLISCTWLESPLWLAYKGHLDKCKTNFIKIRGTDENSVKELQEVMDAYIERIRKHKTLKEVSVWKTLWQQVTRRDFIMPALHILLLLNHSYWSGSIVILFYSIELIAKTTQNETAASIGGIIINLMIVFGGTITGVFIKFYKNKSILLLSTCGASICLLCVSLVIYLQEVDVLPKNSLLCMYFIIGNMVCSSLGQIMVVFTLSGELMPVKHRGLGGVCFVISTSTSHASSLKISPYLFMYLGLWKTFLIYFLNSLVCGILIWKFVPETKDKTLQEIENFYMNGTFEISLSANEETKLVMMKNREVEQK